MQNKKPRKQKQKLPGTFWAITTFFNPAGYKNKIKNYKRFRENTKRQGLNLLTVECTFENKPFNLKKHDADILIQVRSNSILWQKERLLNIGLNNLPQNYDKIAWLDADILFLNNNWIKETSSLLEKYSIVQLFKYVVRMKKGVKSISEKELNRLPYGHGENKKEPGFGFKKPDNPLMAHPGFAWAGRREIFNKIKFYDKAIIGGGDLLMAFAFFNSKKDISPVFLDQNKEILEDFISWKDKISNKVKNNIHYTKGTILHLWHGNSKSRIYHERYNLLKKNTLSNLELNKYGCWEWKNNKKQYNQNLNKYFLIRNEEGNFIRFILNCIKHPRIVLLKDINRKIGLIGIKIKTISPTMYSLLKPVKNKLKNLTQKNSSKK